MTTSAMAKNAGATEGRVRWLTADTKCAGQDSLLGPVAWLMVQQAAGRHTLLGELEWKVMPALILDQAKLYLKDEAFVAFTSWAGLEEATALRRRF